MAQVSTYQDMAIYMPGHPPVRRALIREVDKKFLVTLEELQSDVLLNMLRQLLVAIVHSTSKVFNEEN